MARDPAADTDARAVKALAYDYLVEAPGAVSGPALLFCPGDRPDRYAKAAAAADTVILDLEDAVKPAAKPVAREAVAGHPLDPHRTIVRLCTSGTADHEADVAAVRRSAYSTVMLAKTERPEQAAALAPLQVVALCETPLGVLNAFVIATVPNVVGLMWGAEDLLASIGGSASRFPDGRYRDVARHARSTVLLAASAAGVAAIDSVFLDIADLDGLSAEATDASISGFTAKACIHPAQVPTVRRAFRPDDQTIAWAQRLLAAAELEGGVLQFEGRMVDAPLLTHARAVLRAAGRAG